MRNILQHSLKVKISVAVFLLLSISFSIYLFINEQINSRLYTLELNRKILSNVEYNVERVNRYTASMEQKATDLALAGETFYRMRTGTTSSTSDTEISKYLVDNFKTFPAAIGGGIWFEPYVFKTDQKYYGPYAYWSNGNVVFTWDLNTLEYDYHLQSWYTLALPETWNRTEKRPMQFYWTAPYIDEAGTLLQMVTVDAFMYDVSGKIIGISTADWAIQEMVTFLENNKISAGSHIFLADGNSNTIMANTLESESVMKDVSTVPWMSYLVYPEKEKIKNVDITIDEVEYRAYYTLTEVGMFYGILIPIDEIIAPLTTLFKLNLLTVLIFGFFLLVTLYAILARITNPIVTLTNAAQRISDGDLDVRIDNTSTDEIGILAKTFNVMISRLTSLRTDLEKNVTEKTMELSTLLQNFELKNKDLEKAQIATVNLLEDLEAEKQAVEERVIERTAELETEKDKLLQVTRNMKGAGILLDASQNVIFVNDTTYEMFGLTHEVPHSEILKHVCDYFEGTPIKEHYNNCIAGNTFHVPEIDGNGKVYEIFFHSLKAEIDDVVTTTGYFILIFDISEAKYLERSKSELVAVASHQLRTPLTAMRGNVEMLVDESFGTLNKAQHELLDDIDVSTIRLISMVNDMLDITKIEQGNLEMHLENVMVKEIIDSVIADLGTYAERHEFEIHSEEIGSDVFAHGDKVRIRQIFQNLIDNAIKYSRHPGRLDISAKKNDSSVEVTFKDNGIGVPQNEQAKLFGRFYRATNTANSSSSGSGLGLYIVKSIARQLGGDIRFESEEGKGTTFFVTLPPAQ